MLPFRAIFSGIELSRSPGELQAMLLSYKELREGLKQDLTIADLYYLLVAEITLHDRATVLDRLRMRLKRRINDELELHIIDLIKSKGDVEDG